MYRSLRWADHLCGIVLSCVECPVNMIAKQWYGITSRHSNKKRKINSQQILSRLRYYCHQKTVLLCYVATLISCCVHVSTFIRTNCRPSNCQGDTWSRSLFRYCAKSRKVAGSNPDVAAIWIFHWYNPSGLTIVLGSS